MKTQCKACELGSHCISNNNVQPIGNVNAPLAIFIDKPDNRAVSLLGWLLDSCSIYQEDVIIDYIVRCAPKTTKKLPTAQKKSRLEIVRTCNITHPRPGLHAKSIVAAGAWSIEALIEKPMKEVAGIKDVESGIWAMYNPLYHIMNAGECVRSYRVLFRAAEEAGLKPKFKQVEMFDFAMK